MENAKSHRHRRSGGEWEVRRNHTSRGQNPEQSSPESGSILVLVENKGALWACQMAIVLKNPLANAGDVRHGFDPWVGKMPWRRAEQPSPVFLPGESHGQRSLVDYSP